MKRILLTLSVILFALTLCSCGPSKQCQRNMGKIRKTMLAYLQQSKGILPHSMKELAGFPGADPTHFECPSQQSVKSPSYVYMPEALGNKDFMPPELGKQTPYIIDFPDNHEDHSVCCVIGPKCVILEGNYPTFVSIIEKVMPKKHKYYQEFIDYAQKLDEKYGYPKK